MKRSRKMILGAVARGVGCHVAAWRHPSMTRDRLRRVTSIEHWAEIARIAEAGKLHFVFIADTLAMPSAGNPALLRRQSLDFPLEPVTLLSALSTMTSKIGLVGTVSTSFSEPYNVARSLASLDHLSNGRAGWNVVTTLDANSARNFGTQEFGKKEDRYQRAYAFTKVVKQLWDSWEDDAFVRDP